MTDDLVPLRSALDLAGAAIAGVADDQWSLPTPCAGWDVRTLVDHYRQGATWFIEALGADVPAADADDLATVHDALVAAFAAPGALERTVTVPIGEVPATIALHLRTVEALVHGWDVAVATGQPYAAPDALVEPAIAFSELALQMLPPDQVPFDPPVALPTITATPTPTLALDRLVALLGRTPVTATA